MLVGVGHAKSTERHKIGASGVRATVIPGITGVGGKRGRQQDGYLRGGLSTVCSGRRSRIGGGMLPSGSRDLEGMLSGVGSM